MEHKYVICKSCHWVHFSVSAQYILNWVKEWDELFRTKPKEWLEVYGITDKPPSPNQYYRCFLCSKPHTNCRDALVHEIPDGSTIQPILDPLEKIPT